MDLSKDNSIVPQLLAEYYGMKVTFIQADLPSINAMSFETSIINQFPAAPTFISEVQKLIICKLKAFN